MMLTVKQPTSYGYKSVHDLPTPPSTSRPSPPLAYQDQPYRLLPTPQRSHSPANQPMSAPHRGLPPPAAMTLPPQQQPPPPSQHQPPHQQQQQPPHPPPPAGAPHHHGHPQPPPQVGAHQPAGQPWSALPAPPHQWQGAEESMRSWLNARAEEEKSRQEEERTKQETLRLEQRRIEADMLRASLGGGIPPPMVPLVFAGMGAGGVLPQAALEWAQQFMHPSQSHQLQLLPSQGPMSPDNPRDQQSQHHGPYSGAASTPGSAQGAQGYGTHPGSPTRSRGQTISGGMARPMNPSSGLPSLNTNVPPGGAPSMSAQPAHGPVQGPAGHQQESSSSIFFHHWQPPASQASSSSNRPGTPSGDAPKKRKAIGPMPGPASTDQRLRSPPPFSQSTSSASQGGRKGHKRQKSDMSWYQSSSSGQSRVEESDRTTRGASPIQVSRLGATHERSRSEAGRHSVSSLLSAEPVDSSSAPHQGSSSQHYHHQPQDGQGGEPSTPYRTGGEDRSARRTPEESNQ